MYLLDINDHPPGQLYYRWYRNDRPVEWSKSKDLTVHSNGTLQIGYSRMAVGRYYCIANGSDWALGLRRSRACQVQRAGKSTN